MQSPPVPTPMNRRVSNNTTTTNNLAAPGPSTRTGASPSSYGAMTGISFTNGGGFSFEGRNGLSPSAGPSGSGTGATPRSYKRIPSGLSAGAGGGGMESPSQVFSTSINMDPGSFSTSAQAFGLSSSMMMSSSLRRSYAAAVSGRGGEPMNLSSSFASMSFQPMSLGTSYSKSQVHHLMNRSDAELTGSYVCCNMTLSGLHALLEHVEDAHPAGDEGGAMGGGASGAGGADMSVDNALAMDMELEDIPEASGSSTRSSLSPKPTGPTYAIPPTASSSKPATPDSEKAPPLAASALSLSDVLKSPPVIQSSISKQSSASSSPADGTLATPSTSKQPSPVFAPKVNPTRGFLGVAQQPHATVQQQRLDRAFNEVVAGRRDELHNATEQNDLPKAVAPGVLFASTVAGLGIPTTPPVPGGAGQTTPKEGDAANKTNDPPLPAPSLFSTHKPWRCPNPGCNKAYKQSNGLKYHQQKGQCDFAIHEAVDLGMSIEEAEERNRPFVCAVGAGCTKRYRQMNGLKYHYLNSGEHGQYGLRMLQNGTHPQPPPVPAAPPKRYPASSTSSAITSSRPSAAPYHIPSHLQKPAGAGAANGTSTPGAANRPTPTTTPTANGNANTTPKPGMPRMGVWPSKATPTSTPTRPPAPTSAAAQPRPPVVPPITKGKDAVLYSNVGSTDPMDIMSRMD